MKISLKNIILLLISMLAFSLATAASTHKLKDAQTYVFTSDDGSAATMTVSSLYHSQTEPYYYWDWSDTSAKYTVKLNIKNMDNATTIETNSSGNCNAILARHKPSDPFSFQVQNASSCPGSVNYDISGNIVTFTYTPADMQSSSMIPVAWVSPIIIYSPQATPDQWTYFTNVSIEVLLNSPDSALKRT